MKTNLMDQRFGRWLVISLSDVRKYGTHVSYNCRCDCGTERVVSGSLLKNGHSQSCGCAFVEGAAKSQIKHGLHKHRLYGAWQSMKARCYNKNHVAYARYGGRGIKMCDRWGDFALFVSDNEAMAQPGLTIDRIDNNGNYTPENCRWITSQDQAQNRSDNVWIEYSGKRQTMTKWATDLGITRNALRHRMNSWPLSEALSHPVIEPQHRRAGL